MTKEEATKKFGFDPETVGNRPRGWWVLERLDEDSAGAGAKIGDLCVCARDGGSNPIDPGALKVGDCIGSAQDMGDCTYRYYYYRALEEE